MYREGELADCIYIVTKGEFKVTMRYESSEQEQDEASNAKFKKALTACSKTISNFRTQQVFDQTQNGKKSLYAQLKQRNE